MKTEQHRFVINGKSPPTIEVDSAAKAVYVRFKRAKVAKTVSQNAELSHVAIDLDENDDVIGIEAVGISSFSIYAILKAASVQAPNVDFSRSQYETADMVPA